METDRQKRMSDCSATAMRTLCLLAGVVALAAGCRRSSANVVAAETGAFEEFFGLASPVELQEAAADPIGDIAILVEAQNGDLLVADRIRSQVRRYSPQGRLLAEFGAYGGGPFEFRRIGGMLEDMAGRVVLTDPRLGRVTILTQELRPDTAFMLSPRPRGLVLSMGNTVLYASAWGPRATAITLLDERWQGVWSISAPTPGSVQQYPYWDSYASTLVAATAETFVAAYSLRYPIYVYDRDGRRLDSLTFAPRSFRTVPVLPRGAFAGADALHRIDDWLASFDVISELTIVDTGLLVVVHGVLRRTATSQATEEHRRVDVYDLASRSKLVEDVPVPDGSRVLSGGRGLYLLTKQPPDPWTIRRAAFIGGNRRQVGGVG